MRKKVLYFFFLLRWDLLFSLLPFPFLSILSFLSSLFCFSQYTALILLSCSFFFRCYCHFFRRLFYVIYTPFICSCPYPYFSCHYANISLFSVCEHISLIRVRTYLSYQCTNTSLLSVYEHISLISVRTHLSYHYTNISLLPVYEHISLISVRTHLSYHYTNISLLSLLILSYQSSVTAFTLTTSAFSSLF